MKPQPIPPGPGQESVWDYPRPPRVEPTAKHVQVVFNGVLIADTRRALRVLETAGAPVYYIPPADVLPDALRPAAGQSFCEWKGAAVYFDVIAAGKTVVRAAWSYPAPTRGYAAIGGYFGFYAAKMDRCMVAGEIVRPQPGGFYGGWVTDDIVGPIKGEPGSAGW